MSLHYDIEEEEALYDQSGFRSARQSTMLPPPIAADIEPLDDSTASDAVEKLSVRPTSPPPGVSRTTSRRKTVGTLTELGWCQDCGGKPAVAKVKAGER